MIKANGITKSFSGLQVLKGVDLHIDRSEVVSIVGASGAGKSTLLNILGTLSRPDDGVLEIDGVRPFELSDRQLSRFRGTKIGFVFQFHHLLPEFTTVENVAMQAVIAGMPRSKAVLLAEESLERVGLAERRNHHVTTLSGGERQRAAIARATLMHPKVLLADEPTGNLDEKTGNRIAELLKELNRNLGMSLVIVTHNRELAASMDRSLEMKSGGLHAQNIF